MTINEKEFDLAEGAVFLASRVESGVRVEQVAADLSDVQLTAASLEEFARKQLPGHCGGDDDLVTRTYDVDSIVAPEDDGSRITQLAVQLVDAVSWEAFGGDGTIDYRDRKLVVRQTRSNHAKVSALLQALGKCPVHGSQEGPVNVSIPIGTEDSQDQGRMDIVIYPVGDILQRADTSADGLMQRIANQTKPPNDWAEEGGGSSQLFFAYRPAIIVTTFPETQEEVSAILQDLRKAGGAS